MKNKNKKSSEVSELKKYIRTLKSENEALQRKVRRLLSEVRTLESAINASTLYIDEELANVPVEELVKHFSRKTNIDSKAPQLVDIVDDYNKRLYEKWKCFKCDNGYLRLIIMSRHDGDFYYRSCNCCENRTNLQHYHKNVEGISE